MKIIFEFKINCLPIDLTNLFHENKDISSHKLHVMFPQGECLFLRFILSHLEVIH